MKIAFDNTLPDKTKVDALIAASGLEQNWDASRFFDGSAGNCRFIAAYDRDELVGLGRFMDGGDAADDSQARLDIVVLPDYRNRDIVGTIFKLLNNRKPIAAKHA